MKRLVLFSDGTGNSSAKAEKTNVWRLFEALDQASFDQLAKYDDGVGTSSNKYLAALGGAFGYGLKRNVIDLYKFVCRNYDGAAGDKIYGFGFSRGAFTIRIVAALIATQGLVKGRSESELHANALIAYRQYRAERFKSWSPIVILGRWLRDHVFMPWSGIALRRHRTSRRPGSVPIEFLGLWDTVGAYGMPIDELKWGFDKLIWPMVAVDRHLPMVVRHCSHALALDEQRQTFTPTLFDESFEAAAVQAGRVPSERLTQVWFCGVHSNVGGGYPEDKLSLVPMDWIASQAVAAGLHFDAAMLAEKSAERSGYARIYDSRAGVAAYYRYRPRTIELGRYPDGTTIRPIIHGSVIMRLVKGSDAYAPISLPAEFDVLAPDGQLIPMHGFPYADKGVAMREDRPKSSLAPDPVVDERVQALVAAIAELKRASPQPEMVEQVRDTVWWRRVAYFATLGATLMLVAFPFAADFYASFVERIVNALGKDYGTRWNEGVHLADEYAHSIDRGCGQGASPLCRPVAACARAASSRNDHGYRDGRDPLRGRVLPRHAYSRPGMVRLAPGPARRLCGLGPRVVSQKPDQGGGGGRRTGRADLVGTTRWGWQSAGCALPTRFLSIVRSACLALRTVRPGQAFREVRAHLTRTVADHADTLGGAQAAHHALADGALSPHGRTHRANRRDTAGARRSLLCGFARRVSGRGSSRGVLQGRRCTSGLFGWHAADQGGLRHGPSVLAGERQRKGWPTLPRRTADR
ncbi:MAG: DUF2235 domain-containing protein [Acidovorax sp.]